MELIEFSFADRFPLVRDRAGSGYRSVSPSSPPGRGDDDGVGLSIQLTPRRPVLN